MYLSRTTYLKFVMLNYRLNSVVRRNFVLTFKSIDSTDDLFEEAMKLYNTSFDEEIREDVEVFERSFELNKENCSKYHFLVALKNDKFSGFVSFHLEKEAHIGYIVYLVVDPEYRGQHIAGQLMQEAERIMKTYDPSLSFVMLECEKEASGKSPLESFYRKFDFHPLDIDYLQPALHGGDPVPMNLFLKSFNQTSDDTQLNAIKAMYLEKFSKTNLVSTELLNEYMNNF